MPARKPLLQRRQRPSDLVQLIEALARIKGELHMSEIDLSGQQEARQHLTSKIRDLQTQLDVLTRFWQESVQRQADLTELRDEVTAKIRLLYPEVNPEETEPVRAQVGRYGAHGNLRRTLLSLLAADGGWVSTPAVATAAARIFDIELQTPIQRMKWRRDGVRSALRRLQDEGQLERCNPNKGCRETFWRLKRDDPANSLDHLRALVGRLLDGVSDLPVSEEDESKAG